jgi:16S rRNA (uracil1498-N3)-methyltransferase
MSQGDALIVFNGQGGEYECSIDALQKHSVLLRVLSKGEVNRESPLAIVLAQGISRGERMDYTVQKATELGISEIQPMFTEFCSVKLAEDRVEKKIAHWQAIAVSAAEQSGRTAIPLVKNPLHFREVLKRSGSLLIGDTEAAAEPIKHLSLPKPPIVLLIGPEGGFADSEISEAVKAGAKRISLGPRILRTETAGLVAAALLQSYFGDL